MKAVIVDIDGTLAFNLTKDDKKSWYRRDFTKDEVNEPIKWLLLTFLKAHVKIVLLSGRKERSRAMTEQWLGENAIPYDHLHMRSDDDNRKDNIVKRELFEKHVRDVHDIVFVLDDRDQVVKMWREELGLTCLQVAYGNF